MKSPRGFKSHFPFQCKLGEDLENSHAKYIYIYRNPKDTFVSFFHFTRGYAPYYTWEGLFNRFVSGQNSYGLHVDHVLGWWEHRGKCMHDVCVRVCVSVSVHVHL